MVVCGIFTRTADDIIYQLCGAVDPRLLPWPQAHSFEAPDKSGILFVVERSLLSTCKAKATTLPQGSSRAKVCAVPVPLLALFGWRLHLTGVHPATLLQTEADRQHARMRQQ
jgi:hypothetical protein